MPGLVESHKLAFFSVPKAGSTSIKLVLWELKTGSPWTGDPDRVHPRFSTYPLEAGDFEGLEDYFRFTVVRDPVQRLLSSYGNRVIAHKDLEKSLPAKPLERVLWRLRNPRFTSRPTANRYVGDLGYFQKVSYSIWHHTTSVATFIGTDLTRFHEVYRLEELHGLETRLRALTGKDIRFPREQTSGPKLRLEDLSSAAREALRRHTAFDYDLLRDYYRSPFA